MFEQMLKTRFFRHASILQAGSFVQFGISFVGSIAIARLLGPDQYGVWAIAIALAGIFALFLDWGQGGGAMVLFSKAYAKGDAQEMRNIGGFYIRTTILLYAGVGLVLFLFSGWLGGIFYGRSDIAWYVRFLLLAGFIATGSGLVSIILQVVRSIVPLTSIEIVDQFLKTGMMLAGLFMGFGIYGVAGGQAIGALLGFVVALWVYRKRVQPLGLVPHIRSMLLAARHSASRAYLKFSFPIAVDKNISELYQLGALMILGHLAQPADVGYFKIALSYITLTFLPLGAVSRLLQDQFPKDQADNPEMLRKHFILVSVASGFFTMASGVILVLVAPFLVRLVYGASYAGVLPYIQAFWWYAAVIGFGVGLGSIYRTLNRVSFPIKLNTVCLVIGMPLTWYLLQHAGTVGAVYGFTLMKGTATLIAFFRALWHVRKTSTYATT